MLNFAEQTGSGAVIMVWSFLVSFFATRVWYDGRFAWLWGGKTRPGGSKRRKKTGWSKKFIGFVLKGGAFWGLELGRWGGRRGGCDPPRA